MRAPFITLIIAVTSLLAVSAAPAGGMRCGNDIVNIDDSAFMVGQKCGHPIDKVAVGYTVDEAKKRELFIEEWVYGPKNDYYYFVTLIGGRVAEIRSERK